jgi:hypothetical protein
MPALTPPPSVFEWKETIRYRPEGLVSGPQANSWREWAHHVLSKTVIRMQLDGVL